ncbi:MAG: RNA polymerase sigma factor [Myxococcales bacterium]|nr:RNA polymerase sigma factor [Myxococcales bacterium]
MTELALLMRTQPLDLTTLYEEHARQVWRCLARLGVPPASVEDAVQEVFLTAHQRLRDFEARSAPSTWLIGIAVKVAANARRSSSRRGLLQPVPESMSARGPRPDDELERRRTLFELERVLSLLPDEQREVVVLCDLEQLSAVEVSEALKVKLNTVYSRLRLGRASLKVVLGGTVKEQS